jgi:hypothetical protein
MSGMYQFPPALFRRRHFDRAIILCVPFWTLKDILKVTPQV